MASSHLSPKSQPSQTPAEQQTNLAQALAGEPVVPVSASVKSPSVVSKICFLSVVSFAEVEMSGLVSWIGCLAHV